MFRSLVIGLLSLLLLFCGDLARNNLLDPAVPGFVPLKDLLVGTWSLDNGRENQVYFFEGDGRVELRDYSSPTGGAIDRNASYPQTLVIGFTGTYTLTGNVLRLSFTDSFWNNTNGQPPRPPTDSKLVEVQIQGRILSLKDIDGERPSTRI
mgnify:CR=1 FL=1